MRTRLPFLLALFTSFLVLDGEALPGQIPELMGPVSPRTESPMKVPFGPGERLDYDVKLGFLGKKGEGFMSVDGLETVRGRTTYRVTMAYEGGWLWAKVRDHFTSWFDVANLVTLRSIEDTNQLGRERYKHFELFPERGVWERQDEENSGPMPTSEPLDQISFFYFARTLPLEVGDEYVLNRYYKESGNPVVLRVLRKETVTVPAGTFPTVVVEPVIKTSGLFGEGGKAELYFSDDSSRFLILMRSEIPLIGALSLHLKAVRSGSPLTPITGSPTEDRSPTGEFPGPKS